MDFEVTDNLHFGLQGKKVERTLLARTSTTKSRRATPWSISTSATTSQLPGFESAELQFNVTNLLDEEYFGNISSSTAPIRSAPRYGVTTLRDRRRRADRRCGFFSIGAPRTATLSFK